MSKDEVFPLNVIMNNDWSLFLVIPPAEIDEKSFCCVRVEHTTNGHGIVQNIHEHKFHMKHEPKYRNAYFVSSNWQKTFKMENFLKLVYFRYVEPGSVKHISLRAVFVSCLSVVNGAFTVQNWFQCFNFRANRMDVTLWQCQCLPNGRTLCVHRMQIQCVLRSFLSRFYQRLTWLIQ